MRPYVLLSVAVSVDGHIDDTGPDRLCLSGPADFDRVDQVRADSDAIMVGAGTVRADNPRLLVHSPTRRAQRVARGAPEHPLKVTVTATGKLDPDLALWRHGQGKLVYTVDSAAAGLRGRLDGLAEVVALGCEVDFGAVLDDLGERGVRRLLVEGGGQIHTTLLSQGLADELHLAVAPLVVGQADAPRFLNPAGYPGGSARRMRLVGTQVVDDVVVIKYLPRCAA